MTRAQPLQPPRLAASARDFYHSGRIPPCWGSGCPPDCPDKGVPEMIIDCAHYRDGRRQGEGAVPLEEAAARCGQGGFVGLRLFEPGMEALAAVPATSA